MTGDGNERRVIARANLCDDYFDRLVIETSRVIRHRNHLGLDSLLDTPNESPSTSCDNSQEVSSVAGSWTGNEARLEQASGQPKRPMNAFMVWGQTIRRELHQRYSNVQNALLSKALGRVWRTMEATEKEPFVRRANLIKANHKREYPNYRYQPRRVQERRQAQKSNMLIGINLNHPVNHQPSAHSDLRAAIAQPSPAAGGQHQQHQHQVAHNDQHHHHHQQQQQQAKGDKFVRRDSVQTFEYYPYPLTAASLVAANNPNLEQQFTGSCSSYNRCSDYGCVNQDSYQQQPPPQPPQLLQSEPTVVYQSYQQFAYGNSSQNNIAQQAQQYHHHQHQHPNPHQALAIAYNEQRSHHLHQGYGG